MSDAKLSRLSQLTEESRDFQRQWIMMDRVMMVLIVTGLVELDIYCGRCDRVLLLVLVIMNDDVRDDDE